ncbi:MAG TPA: hypothetical protein VF753_16015 [Terriglobales bacterium]
MLKTLQRLVSDSGKWRLFAVAAVLAIPAAGVGQTKGNDAHFDSVSTQKIVLVDAQGRPRMVLGAPLPNPRVNGKEYPRSSPVNGIQFLDVDGNETGGLALIDSMGGGAFCFDFTTAEGLCFTKTKDSAYITLLDPPAAGAPAGQPGAARITISQEKGDASIVLGDGNGKDRVIFSVNKNNQAEIKLLDADGRVIFHEPQ